MSPAKKSTRQSTFCPLIGSPSELPKSDLPTLKQVLQSCFHEKIISTDPNIAPDKISGQVTVKLVKVWEKVNPDIPLINNPFKKVKNAYNQYMEFKRNRINKVKTKNNYIKRLDKLFDICSCTCKFTPHYATCEPKCKLIHINCKCSSDKIPHEELAFMKDQRDKVGPTGKYQLGSVDKVHHNKRKRTLIRRNRDRHLYKKVASDPVSVTMSAADTVRLSSTSSEDGTETDPLYEPPVFSTDSVHFNLENLAREADRYLVSDRAAAALATGVLIDRGIVTPTDSSAMVTRSMVRRARKTLRETVKVLGDDPVTGVYFDGRKDLTCTKKKDEDGVTRYSKVKEEHYVMTSEPDGTYMTHLAPQKGNTYFL